jgi:hypothetical protein
LPVQAGESSIGAAIGTEEFYNINKWSSSAGRLSG